MTLNARKIITIIVFSYYFIDVINSLGLFFFLFVDSFISIKFENNGVGSWEKGAVGTVPKVSLIEHCDNDNNKVAVIEHVAKPRMQLRWRKRIGHIFHLSRLKRSSTKGGHVGTKLEGVKVRYGWMRTLTKRKTKE